MSILTITKAILTESVLAFGRRRLVKLTRSRKETNLWLRHHCAAIEGKVLSVGSGRDADKQGRFYRDYFPKASSYTTSESSREIAEEHKCDLIIDIRSMPGIADGSYDCVFCSGVLEHVDRFQAGLDEMTRILKAGGILLLGVPFGQPLHLVPQDYWRFTEYGIRHMLSGSFEILELKPIDTSRGKAFPAAYWVKARKKNAAT